MLINGKSGTMLPRIAYSRAGQFCQEGSCAWQRRIPSLWAGFKSDHHRPAPTLDQTDTKSLWLCYRNINPNGPVRRISQGGLCRDGEIQRPRRTAPERARPHHLKIELPTSVQACRKAAKDGRPEDRSQCPTHAPPIRVHRVFLPIPASRIRFRGSDPAVQHARHRWSEVPPAACSSSA